MRRPLACAFILCCIAAAGCAPKSDAGAPADSAVIARAFHLRSDALQKAESAKDGEASTNFYTDSAIVQPAGSPQINGKANIGALYAAFFKNPALKELRGTPTSAVISATGDMAYEIGVNRIVMAGPKGDLLDMGKFVIVWKHEKGDWYVTALSFTSDAAAPK